MGCVKLLRSSLIIARHLPWSYFYLRVYAKTVGFKMKFPFVIAFSHLDLGIGEDEGSAALLDNSAAKHKMAIRPQRKRPLSESRQRDSNPGDDAAMETNQHAERRPGGRKHHQEDQILDGRRRIS